MGITAKNGTTVALSTLLVDEGASSYADRRIASVSREATETLRDGLFACCETERGAALSSARVASRNGAIAVAFWKDLAPLVSELQGTPEFSGVELIAVSDPRVVFGRACHALLDYPGRRLRLIGVTGSAGKTSLSYVLGGVLAEAGRRVGLIGSLGVYDGKKLQPSRETTPQADELARLFERMADSGCECAIVEASSVGLAEKRLAGVEFDAVCLTNLRRDHLDYHGTVDQYRRAKMQIFSCLKPTGVAICNVDDRVTEAALHMIDRPLLTVGIQPTTCSVSGTPVERLGGEQTFYIVAGSDAAPIRSKIIGNEHIYNCLEAAAVALAWKIDMKTIARGIERVEHIPGRMESVDCGQPFAVCLDRANSPDSLNAALEALRLTTRGSVYCVLCAPNDGDRSKRPLMARGAESRADFLAITRGNLPESQKQEAIDDLVKGLEKPKDVRVIEDRKEAIVWALSRATVDDSVLIVGQDVSTLDAINERFVPDRQFVRNWLYENLVGAESFWFN